ncbi:hypothetical protein [[Bacillus] enclensis]|nr:hypothetical protein [[Bacillus] enclensis]MBH9965587.1 hypothetical protein [[Bacillus] enclensis]
MNEANRTQLLIDYLRVLSNLKHADYFCNKEISDVMKRIETDLKLK